MADSLGQIIETEELRKILGQKGKFEMSRNVKISCGFVDLLSNLGKVFLESWQLNQG